MSVEIGTRRPGRAVARRILFPVSRLITRCRLEPDSVLIAGIVKLFGAPGARGLHSLVPKFSDFILSPSTTSHASPGDPRTPAVSDQRALAVAAIAAAAGDTNRIIAVLEAHIDRQAAIVAPQVFERLAEAYLGTSSPARATEVLRTGLGTHEGDGRLHRTLALALSAMSDWAGAVTHWEQTPTDLQAAASAWTVIGVARAYRCTGNPLRAAELARRAAESHPDNELLREEIRICRPFVIDWSESFVADAPTGRSAHTGEITSMGFLHGGSDALIGWVDVPEEANPEVLLLVNNLVLATTVAVEALNVSPPKAFSINCADLLQYLGDGDIVQVTCNGKAVSLPGLGNAARVACGHPSEFARLRDRLDEGYVFTKDGRLRPGHNADSKRAVLDLFEEVSSIIVDGTGQPVFPFYGNLLGAVREGDFIVHDVDGFDVMYLCSSNQPGAVRAEIGRVCQLLIEQGYDLDIEPWSIMIRRNRSDAIFIDMNYGWFTDSDELHVSFGWRFEPAPGRAHFIADRRCYLADRQVPIPGNSEEVLQQLYGPGWLVPDQGFASRKQLKRDDAYLLKTSEIRAIIATKQNDQRI